MFLKFQILKKFGFEKWSNLKISKFLKTKKEDIGI
jgi:hypothetical protein